MLITFENTMYNETRNDHFLTALVKLTFLTATSIIFVHYFSKSKSGNFILLLEKFRNKCLPHLNFSQINR